MLDECLEGLNINPSGVYADVTFGGGGHSKAILERLGDDGSSYSTRTPMPWTMFLTIREFIFSEAISDISLSSCDWPDIPKSTE